MENTLLCSNAYIAMSKSDKFATKHSILTISPTNLLRNWKHNTKLLLDSTIIYKKPRDTYYFYIYRKSSRRVIASY